MLLLAGGGGHDGTDHDAGGQHEECDDRYDIWGHGESNRRLKLSMMLVVDDEHSDGACAHSPSPGASCEAARSSGEGVLPPAIITCATITFIIVVAIIYLRLPSSCLIFCACWRNELFSGLLLSPPRAVFVRSVLGLHFAEREWALLGMLRGV